MTDEVVDPPDGGPRALGLGEETDDRIQPFVRLGPHGLLLTVQGQIPPLGLTTGQGEGPIQKGDRLVLQSPSSFAACRLACGRLTPGPALTGTDVDQKAEAVPPCLFVLPGGQTGEEAA